MGMLLNKGVKRHHRVRVQNTHCMGCIGIVGMANQRHKLEGRCGSRFRGIRDGIGDGYDQEPN